MDAINYVAAQCKYVFNVFSRCKIASTHRLKIEVSSKVANAFSDHLALVTMKAKLFFHVFSFLALAPATFCTASWGSGACDPSLFSVSPSLPQS